jgi:hypothetical protein
MVKPWMLDELAAGAVSTNTVLSQPALRALSPVGSQRRVVIGLPRACGSACTSAAASRGNQARAPAPGALTVPPSGRLRNGARRPSDHQHHRPSERDGPHGPWGTDVRPWAILAQPSQRGR